MHTSFLKYFDEVARQRSIRKAAQEQARGKPPHAFRELFRQVRKVLG